MLIRLWFFTLLIWFCFGILFPWIANFPSVLQPTLFVAFFIALMLTISIRSLRPCFTGLQYPGPLVWRILDRRWFLSMSDGYCRNMILALHRKYGNVVQVGVDELSFNSVHALRAIYQSPSFQKDFRVYTPSANGIFDMKNAIDADLHTKYLRHFGPAFSDEAVLKQETLVRSHVDHFVRRIITASPSIAGKSQITVTLDLYRMLLMLTGDIANDLLVMSPPGSPESNIERGALSTWLEHLPGSLYRPVEVLVGLEMISMMPQYAIRLVKKLCHKLYPRDAACYYDSIDKLWVSINADAGRLQRHDWLAPAFLELSERVCRNQHAKSLTEEELNANVAYFQIAGSEATATALAGVFFLLGSHSDKLDKIKKIIRKRFASTSDVSIEKLAKLPYLNAIINETLRLYPPIPTGLRRIATRKTTIAGYTVPPGTIVSCDAYAMGRTAEHFHLPDTFAPERWLSPPPREFANDVSDAWVPFSIGQRGCLGKRFAYAEMRLIIAKMLFHFDIELRDPNQPWIDKQRSYFSWMKIPLRVRLTERSR